MPECRVIQIALVMHTNLTNMIAVHPQVLFQLFKQKLLPKLFTCKIVLINLWLLYAVFDELPASSVCDAHEPDQYDCTPSTSVVSTI